MSSCFTNFVSSSAKMLSGVCKEIFLDYCQRRKKKKTLLAWLYTLTILTEVKKWKVLTGKVAQISWAGEEDISESIQTALGRRRLKTEFWNCHGAEKTGLGTCQVHSSREASASCGSRRNEASCPSLTRQPDLLQSATNQPTKKTLATFPLCPRNSNQLICV